VVVVVVVVVGEPELRRPNLGGVARVAGGSFG
jgi:hypothetical protein